MNIKKTIRRILKESAKEKLEKLLFEKGLSETLSILRIDIDKLSSMMNVSVEELVQIYNPFEKFFTDEEFQNSLRRFMNLSYTYEGIFTKTMEEIVKFIIEHTLYEYHREKINDRIGNIEELAYMRYSDWLKNTKRFKTLYNEHKK